jgi:DNA-binding transcriptional ArsR family regulator
VSELAEAFAVSRPAISRDLKVLERAGLIVRSREAQWRPSRVEAEPFDEAVEWTLSRKQTWEPGWTDSKCTCAGSESTMSAPTHVTTTDHEVLITRARARVPGLDRLRRGGGPVRPRAPSTRRATGSTSTCASAGATSSR